MRTSKNQVWQVAGSIVCLLAILATLGGHWMVLQSFAWARMLHENSRNGSFGAALAKTFDGQHPCTLCVAIDQGKSSEKKSDQQKPAGKIDAFIVSHSLTLRGVASFPTIVPLRRAFNDWLEPPPSPPPRLA